MAPKVAKGRRKGRPPAPRPPILEEDSPSPSPPPTDNLANEIANGTARATAYVTNYLEHSVPYDPSAPHGPKPGFIDKSRFFKGHLQPEVSERLQEAKNFLADEDPNRCLGFDHKIAQIEEYIKYIQDEKIDHDEFLLRDVKVMAEVHRDWVKRAQEGLPETKCHPGPSIMPVSMRLIPANDLVDIQEEKEAMGVITQTREDHAPFTTTFEEDHREFIQAMRYDACADPVEVDENSNLLWVESRAYAWALREPSMIPLWLHPTKGIPKNGILPTEEKPWYRAAMKRLKVSGTTNSRPAIQRLPDYLKKRQDWINFLLQGGGDRTESGQQELEDLLHLHEPQAVRDLHDRYLAAKYDREFAERQGTVPTRKTRSILQQALEASYVEFRKEFGKWLRSFEKYGVQLMVLRPGVTPQDVPGVFYLPGEDIIAQYQYVEVEYAQAYLRQIKSDGFNSLNAQEKRTLIEVLRNELNEAALAEWDRQTAHEAAPQGNEDHIFDVLADSLFSEFLTALASQFDNIRLSRPGEMKGARKECLYLKWDFPKVDEVLTDANNVTDDLVAGVDLSAIQNEINGLLKRSRRGSFPGMNLPKDEEERLTDLLIPFAHLPLRTKIYQAKLANEKLKAQLSVFSEDKIEAEEIEKQRKEMWDAWLRGFKDHEVTLKRQRSNEGHPGILYWRGDFPANENPTAVMKRATAEINHRLTTGITNGEEGFRQGMARALQNVHYPRLAKAELALDALQKQADEANADRDEQESTRLQALHDSKRAEWWQEFLAWIETFRSFKVEVRQCPKGEEYDWRGDPSTLFYHGPIRDEYPHYLYRLGVDHKTTLSDEEIAKAKSLLDMGTAAGLEGADLGMQVRAYLPLLLADTLDESSESRDEVFVPNFEDWVTRLRVYKAGPNGSHAPRPTSNPSIHPKSLPSINEAMEHWINSTLRRTNLDAVPNDKRLLDKRIYKYWQVQHKVLTDNLKAAMLSEGYTAEELEDMDWTIVGRCRGGFERFKDECRRFGFKIIREGNGIESDYAVSKRPNQVTTDTGPNPGYGSIPPENRVVQVPLPTFAYEPSEVISTKEKRINSLLQNLKDEGYKFVNRWVGRRPSSFSQKTEDEAIELQQLLQDFYPQNILNANQELVSGKLKGNTFREKIDHFEATIGKWMDLLIELGSVHVSESIDPDLLGYQSKELHYLPLEARLEILGSNKSQIVERTKTQIHAAEMEEVKAAKDKAAQIQYTTQEITKLEREINKLLQQNSRSHLKYDQMMSLYSHLSAVMVPDLRAIHENFLEKDLHAKSKMLLEEEAATYSELARDYDDIMTRWIASFPPEGIRIGRREDADVNSHSGVLYLNNLPETKKPPKKTKPLHIQLKEVRLNDWMKNTTGLSDADDTRLETTLRTLYRSHSHKYRQRILVELAENLGLQYPDQIGSLVPPELLQAERSSYIESRLALGFTTWQMLLRKASSQLHKDTSALVLTESRPGFWDITLQHLDPDALAEAPANVPYWMKSAETAFLYLAKKVRGHDALLPEEKVEAERRLAPVSLSEINKMEDQIAENKVKHYYQQKGDDHPFTNQEMEELVELTLRYHWQRFGYMFPALREEIIPEVKVPDPVGNLVDRARQPWDSAWSWQVPAPSVHPQPSESETRELQVEINNLLTRWNRNEITEEERKELFFLLDGRLMPVKLQSYHNQVHWLFIRSRSDEGLGPSESLRLIELTNLWENSRESWIEELAKTGIILDTFWYSRGSLNELFSRAMEWKRAATQIPARVPRSTSFREYPALGHEYLDAKVERVHKVYALLRQYLDAGIGSGITSNRLPFLDQVPLELREVHDHLRQAFESLHADGGDGQDDNPQDAEQVQLLEEDFVKLYLDWYRSLGESEQIEALDGTLGTKSHTETTSSAENSKTATDFTNKAERRGIQRAATEHALNLLATNQEQHRPNDRFRRLDLPARYQRTPKEVPLWLPLEPWKRPVEMDTFEFTKKLLTFQQWKDSEYEQARTRTVSRRSGLLPAPINFNGPFTLNTADDQQEAARRKQLQLTLLYSRLGEAERLAPRPLIQQLLLRIQEGMNLDSRIKHRLWDEEDLTESNLEIVEELTEPSWDEERRPFTDFDLGLSDEQWANLQEFEKDVDEHRHLLPLWTAPELPPSIPITDPDDEVLYRQPKHNPAQPSLKFMSAEALKQNINTQRLLEEFSNLHLWTNEEATRYFTAMHTASRIHFDAETNSVSQIPLSGHPENRYVVSRDTAAQSPGVHILMDGIFEVQYDMKGTVGPPIVQPNKYHYLQRIAYRIGRDISKNLHTIAGPAVDERQYLRDQYQAFEAAARHMNPFSPADLAADILSTSATEPTVVNLQRLATELNGVAPDLAQDAGINPETMDEKEAASLLQMEVLEEASNNWESRFPENEHVWEFARPRVELHDRTVRGRIVQVRQRQQQFFRMDRYPLPCQCEATQSAIEQCGPQVQEELERDSPTPEPTETQIGTEMRAERPIEMHRGMNKPPFFPFGETPYSAAYLDWRMQNDLKDVPEFQSKPQKRGFFSRAAKPKKPRVAPYALPEIGDWKPENISEEEHRANMIELAKSIPSFPNPNILENYHTQAEIAVIRRREAYQAIQAERRNATTAMENLLGKKLKYATAQETYDAARILNLDVHDPRISTSKKTEKVALTHQEVSAPVTRRNPDPRIPRPGSRGGVPRLVSISSAAGPARNTRSRSPRKRPADDHPAGQGLPKKKKKNVTFPDGRGLEI